MPAHLTDPLGRRRFALALLGLPLVACGKTPPAASLREDPAAEGLLLDNEAQLPDAAAPGEAAPPSESAPVPKPPTVDGSTTLDAHLDALRERYEPLGWVVRGEGPFAVVGDGSPERVERHATGTVRWAVAHLSAAYFERPPEVVVTIWLFEGAESYERNVVALFGEAPGTPYGYYSPAHDALVMDIATGGGTLVHEIVHPYMAANFPACPDWFNEGLASLYEQSAERGGAIVGLTNWRLAGLQQALAAGEVPSFESLCRSAGGFYTDDPGSNYAQARYLCYWLQERGLLHRYYQDFRRQAHLDPSGYQTLTALVGPDMDDFRERWEREVMALRYG